MRTCCDISADLRDVTLHGFGVGDGESKCCSDTAGWADCTEQIGAVIALIGRLPGSRAAPCPLPHLPVLLTDPRFVLEPDLDGRCLGQIGEMRFQRGGKVFLNAWMIPAS